MTTSKKYHNVAVIFNLIFCQREFEWGQLSEKYYMEIVHWHILFAVYFIFIIFIAEYYAQTEIYEDYNMDPEFDYSQLGSTIGYEKTSYSSHTKIVVNKSK